jgi:uncharacterized protein YtpQ (UPF0354 family)
MNASFVDRAVAYVKAQVPENGSAAIELSREDSPIMRPLTDGLLICYIVDEGDSYHYVQQRHLDRAGVDPEELHTVGIRNLEKLAANRDLRVQPYGAIHAVLMGGDFEASLILLNQLWDEHFRQFVSGDYAIAIPARDVLAFCDDDSEEGIGELEQLFARIAPMDDHLISDKIYVRREGKLILRSPAGRP